LIKNRDRDHSFGRCGFLTKHFAGSNLASHL